MAWKRGQLSMARNRLGTERAFDGSKKASLTTLLRKGLDGRFSATGGYVPSDKTIQIVSSLVRFQQLQMLLLKGQKYLLLHIRKTAHIARDIVDIVKYVRKASFSQGIIDICVALRPGQDFLDGIGLKHRIRIVWTLAEISEILHVDQESFRAFGQVSVDVLKHGIRGNHTVQKNISILLTCDHIHGSYFNKILDHMISVKG